MRAIFTKLNAWFRPIRRHPWLASGFFVCLLVVGVLAFAGFAHAEDFITGVFNGLLRFFVQILLAMARFCIGMTIFFLRFFIELSAYNGYIDTPTVVIGWLLVRDVANMFFVVVLLVIAFGTILGIEQYEWKKTMGHFLLAAIFINFSKTICGLIIDVAHVFTMTFLNAVSAAAGGNLITLFNFDKLLSFIRAPNVGDSSQGLELDLAIAGVAAFLFAFLALWTIGAYLIIMLARVLVLWILIILSPIAYILQAIPHTKSYATQWWSKFMKQVMVAPVMVFFFWLAFATLGSGNIASQQLGLDIEQTAGAAGAGSVLSEASDPTPSASILEGTTWENMANFFIAAGMLWVGLMVVGQMGVVAGGMTQSVMSAAKKVAGYATGYVVGRFLYEKAGAGAKGALWHMPLGGRFWSRQGRTIGDAAKYLVNAGAERRVTRSVDREKTGVIGRYINKGKGFDNKYLKLADRALGYVYNRGAGTLTGGLLAGDTAGRADKRAEDWKEAAERKKKIVEESYSTSSTSMGGKLKTEVTGQLKFVEEQAAEKKEAKVEQKLLELLDEKRTDWAATMARKRAGVAGKTKADRRDYRRQKEEHDAQLEAKELTSRGKLAQASSVVRSVYQKHFKEDQEAFESMGYNERVNKAQEIAERLKDTSVSDNEKKNLRTDALRLISVAAKNGPEEYMNVLDNMVTEVYGTAQEMTRSNMGQRMLEAITGRQISSEAEFDDAQKLLGGNNTFKNSSESQAVLYNLSSAVKQVVGKGQFSAAGAIIEDKPTAARSFDTAPGSSVSVRFAYKGNADDQSMKEGNEDYFRLRVNFKEATNLYGYMNTKKDAATGMSKVESVDARQIDALSDALSQFGDSREVAGGFASTAASFNKKTNFTPAAQAQMITMLEKVRDSYESAGLHEVYDKLVKTQFSDWIGDVPPRRP